MFRTLLPTALALIFALAAPAAEAFTLTRNSTLVDDHGGRLVVQTTGEGEAGAGERHSVADFDNFHPRGDQFSIDGQVSRDAQRVLDSVSATYEGDLVITRAEGAPVTLRFNDLVIVRGDRGRRLQGTVTVDGTDHAANDLPRPVRRLLWLSLRLLKI